MSERRDEHIASLLADRFVDVTEFRNLRIGSRVRHNGHQWPDAYTAGTGNIERIFHQPDSAWEKAWGRPNVEIIVQRDNGEEMFVADYHVEVIEVQP